MVATSVAVATPSITATRMSSGSANAGKAINKVLAITPSDARGTPGGGSRRARNQHTSAMAAVAITAGMRPPMNNAVIETPQTAPMVMSTRLGGIVSVMAPDEDNKATSSSGLAPRFFISGNSAGAIAAMSAAFEPGMPDT